MSFWRLVWRGVCYHRRAHLAMGAGVAVAAAVIVGALLVGDAVRWSLRQVAAERLGRVQVAMPTGDRFFQAEHAIELTAELAVPVEAAILATANAEAVATGQRASQLQVIGVSPAFWAFAESRAPGRIVANRRLAEELGLKAGDELVIRLETPSLLPRDAALSPIDDATVPWRVTVDAIADADRFGNFSLQANQLAPANLFVPREELARELGREGRANLLLAGEGADGATLEAALATYLTLADAGYRLVPVPGKSVAELRADRVFMEASVADVAAGVKPGSEQLLTYFVNDLRLAEATAGTPYSFVTASSAWAELGEDGIALTRWCAVDIGAEPGDRVTLTYFVMDAGNRVATASADFVVKTILEMDDPRLDPAMMPDFPGLADAADCRAWETGVAIDIDRVRGKDEAYWDTYRGTPKALVSLAAGQRLWANRFGAVTAVRFPTDTPRLAATVQAALVSKLGPRSLGFAAVPVGKLAQAGWRDSLDFGQLFIAFSFFLVIAALLLVGLLFSFGVKQRLAEAGTLLALGCRRAMVRRLLLAEALVIGLPATLLGGLLGTLYTRLILIGLSTVWQGAVGDWPIRWHLEPQSLLVGMAAALVMALLTIRLAMRRAMRQSVRDLLGGELGAPATREGTVHRWAAAMLAALALLGAVAIGLTAREASSPMAFFAAGGLVLVAGLLASHALLLWLATMSGSESPGLWRLGMRNAVRRRGRSLAVIAMLACGVFVVLTLQAHRLQADSAIDDPAGPAGGCALIGWSALPIHEDLNDPKTKAELGLEEAYRHALAFRVLDGDDISCLNLNRAQQPRLAAIEPEELAGRFTFIKPKAGADDPWQRLSREPVYLQAVGDLNSITYTLGKKLWQSLDYVAEDGQGFPVLLVGGLANSILRGYLIVGEEAFLRYYPSAAGKRLFLFESDGDQAAIDALEAAFSAQGLEVRRTSEVLAEYNRVQNTYLSIFQALGGLGVLLGSLGLGMLVLHHAQERRGELALLRAVGFTRGQLRQLLIAEHAGLFAVGLLLGSLAAAVALIPAIASASGPLAPISPLAAVAILAISGLLWSIIAAHAALRGDLLPALRRE